MRTAAALFALLLLTIGIYWQLTLSTQYTWLENPDQALQVRPWLEFQAREVHAGRIPMWDPNHYAGQSLIGQVQPGLTSWPNWILFAMPLRDGARTKSIDGVSVRELPGGRAITLIHKGPYDTLGHSYAKIIQYLKSNGHAPQCPTREVYLKGPGMIFKGNPKNYLTEIQMLIE